MHTWFITMYLFATELKTDFHQDLVRGGPLNWQKVVEVDVRKMK